MNKTSYFSREIFDFLEELAKNNSRDWFVKNKILFERDVKAPMLSFISDFAPYLKSISPHFVVDPRPSGGSMFRLNRDTRFSRDKSPYKTWVAAKFNHAKEGNNVHAPGFYLHLEPNNSMGGGGLWHPDADSLARVRQEIADRNGTWKSVRNLKLKIEGDRLKRPPQGYDANHPFIEDIKQKDFYSMVKFSEKQVCSADFMDIFVSTCRKVAPLVSFLTRVLELPW